MCLPVFIDVREVKEAEKSKQDKRSRGSNEQDLTQYKKLLHDKDLLPLRGAGCRVGYVLRMSEI